MANYQFLGNVRKYRKNNSRLILTCEDDYRLNVTFLLPHMIRVVLDRPGDEECLDYPLAGTYAADVPVELQTTESHIVMRSSLLDVIVQREPCRLTIKDQKGAIVNQDDLGMGIGWDGREVCNWKQIAAGEKFFGLGEKSGSLDKRGAQWEMWNTDNPHHDNRSDPLYQSIPFFIGMHDYQAYGIYFNNSYRSTFNFGAGNLRYFSFAAAGGKLDYFFIYGPKVEDVVATYTQLTGRTPLPPMWALGYQQCRWSYFPDTEVVRIAQTFRDKKIPADVIYLDIHYMDGYRVFTWDKNRFADPAALMEQLKDMGFKVVVIIDPGVKKDSDYVIAQQGLKDNHFVKYPDGELYVGEVWPGPSYFPDFSRPQTRNWWGNLFAKLLDVGVRGFWNDMNEPAVWGKAFPNEVIFNDEGRISNHKKMHNLYGFLMAQTCYEGVKQLRPQQRPFVITRAGFAGIQRFSSVWTGDNQSTEEHLQMGLRMLQGLGISGIPFVGPDIGGFGGNPSAELFARWIQVGAFAPFFRTHSAYGTKAQEPWSFGEHVEKIARAAIERRYMLLPYLYSLFWEANQTGAPIMRPMFFHDQQDANVYDWQYQQQFYVGAKMLVAPITRVGHYLQKVYLPRGKWLERDSGKVYQGAATVVVDAPLEKIPVFLREGAIIPSREIVQYVEQPFVDLLVDVFPSSSRTTFHYYEDDGTSFDYLQGKYRLCKFICHRQNNKLHFEQRIIHDQYHRPKRLLKICFHDIATMPNQVLLQNRLLPAIDAKISHGYRYLPQQKILKVQIEDSACKLIIEVHANHHYSK